MMDYEWKTQNVTVTLHEDDEYSWDDYLRDKKKQYEDSVNRLTEELKKEGFTEGTKTQ